MSKSVIDLVKAARAQITKLDVERAKVLHENKTIFIDVRESAEQDKGMIDGAYRVARGVLEWKVGKMSALSDKAAQIIVYCESGSRSALAAQVMAEIGFTNALSLKGGYAAWLDDE